MTSQTLALFLKPDTDTIDIYDCGSKSLVASNNGLEAD